MKTAVVSKWWLAGLLWLCAAVAGAQSLPVAVHAAGNDAEIRVGPQSAPLAEISLAFEDASNLSPAALGVSVQQIAPFDPLLAARLPALADLGDALALLITIEPPAGSGFSFRGAGRMEVHTSLLAYAPGSAYRLFKAPIGGAFRDVTDEIASGSVRARSTYGGFSQFLVAADYRDTGAVITEKLDALRQRVATLPLPERQAFDARLDTIETAVGETDYATAIAAIDALRARAQARAGRFLANEWHAGGLSDNQAGDLAAAAASLRFSVAYLRDFGP